MIELRNVNKSFDGKQILRNLSLSIPKGQTTAIVGPSGTGKSVALKHIVGLLRPDSGQVLCFGTDMGTANEQELFAVRRRFGMLFQDGALFDSMSVGDNIAFPLIHHAPEMTPAERAAEQQLAALTAADLTVPAVASPAEVAAVLEEFGAVIISRAVPEADMDVVDEQLEGCVRTEQELRGVERQA